MVVRKSARREVRLDPDTDAFLEEELQRRHVTFAAWLREKVGEDREQRELQECLAALEELFALEVDVGLDPDDPDGFRKLMEEIDAEEDREWNESFN